MVKDQIRKIWSREIYMSRGIVQSLLKPEKLHLFVFNVETSSDGLHQSWLSYGLDTTSQHYRCLYQQKLTN